MILQLSPTVPLDTPRGPARAHLVIDYGEDHHLYWVCFIDATGECWTFANGQVKLRENPTMAVRPPGPASGKVRWYGYDYRAEMKKAGFVQCDKDTLVKWKSTVGDVADFPLGYNPNVSCPAHIAWVRA